MQHYKHSVRELYDMGTQLKPAHSTEQISLWQKSSQLKGNRLAFVMNSHATEVIPILLVRNEPTEMSYASISKKQPWFPFLLRQFPTLQKFNMDGFLHSYIYLFRLNFGESKVVHSVLLLLSFICQILNDLPTFRIRRPKSIKVTQKLYLNWPFRYIKQKKKIIK